MLIVFKNMLLSMTESVYNIYLSELFLLCLSSRVLNVAIASQLKIEF